MSASSKAIHEEIERWAVLRDPRPYPVRRKPELTLPERAVVGILVFAFAMLFADGIWAFALWLVWRGIRRFLEVIL